MSTLTLAPPVPHAGAHPRVATPAGPRLRRPGGPPATPAAAPEGARATLPRTSTAAPWDRVRLSWPGPDRATERRVGDLPPVPATAEGPVVLPDPAAWAASVVRAGVESLLGVRPATQLERWLSADLYDAVRRRAGLAVRTQGRAPLPQAPRVLSSHAQTSHDGRSAEVCVELHDGTKVRAAAVRIEVFRGRWRAVALEIG